jgi:hypothetical protein
MHARYFGLNIAPDCAAFAQSGMAVRAVFHVLGWKPAVGLIGLRSPSPALSVLLFEIFYGFGSLNTAKTQKLIARC